jgi:chaperonin GroES
MTVVTRASLCGPVLRDIGEFRRNPMPNYDKCAGKFKVFLCAPSHRCVARRVRNPYLAVGSDRAAHEIGRHHGDQDTQEHGLYLPPGVKEKEKVNSGIVVQVGPGYAVPNPGFLDQEQWSTSPKDPIKYLPLQAEEGDLAVFLRDSAIDIEYDERKFLIVPHSAILMLVRRNDYVQGLEQ